MLVKVVPYSEFSEPPSENVYPVYRERSNRMSQMQRLYACADQVLRANLSTPFLQTWWQFLKL